MLPPGPGTGETRTLPLLPDHVHPSGMPSSGARSTSAAFGIESADSVTASGDAAAIATSAAARTITDLG